MRRLMLLLWAVCLSTGLCLGQSTPTIKELEKKRKALQEQMEQSETLLRSTKKDVGSQLNSLNVLSGQIAERRKYIQAIEADVRLLDREIGKLGRQLKTLERDLNDRKKKYAQSVVYLRKNRSIEEKLLFIFSAQSLSQTYRRMRYVREYATYQRLQGEELKKKQAETEAKRKELNATRAAQAALLKQGEAQKRKLESQEAEQKKLLSQLQKKQKSLQNELARKRKQANRLNAQIDRLVEAEMAKARKRAEAEARKAGQGQGGKTSSGGKAKPMDRFLLSKDDQKLAADFAANKGKLPVPITGPYMIVSHYGQYAVEGLKNVKLDNKGIDIQGKAGAMARAVFDGEVSAVFTYDGLIGVLVRHGSYISLYCNLTSTSVSKGDKVKTRDVIGKVYAPEGRPVLHFQLRKEQVKLNPELYLAKP